MATQENKTFWDIEKEKTWSIYLLFGFLLLFYYISIFIIWLMIKFVVQLRIAISGGNISFGIFGYDTLFVLIIATIVALIHWYYSNANVVSKILLLLDARYPDKYDKYHYIFNNVVDEIESSVGGIEVERCILPTGAMNAFALANFTGRKVIGITEGLLSRLDRNELQAVVAHEMAHIISNDCLQTTITCSIFSVFGETLERYNKRLLKSEPHPLSSWYAGRDWTPRGDAITFSVLSVFVLFVLFVMNTLSQFLKMFISREREYRADASAVKLTRNPISLASALYKIGTHWRGAGYGGDNLSPIFILSPRLNPLSEKDDFYATLFSTHPPLIKRLQTILNFAHADLTQITEHLHTNKTLKTEYAHKEPMVKFLVEHENKWLGPYDILQLQALDWLHPDTKMHLDGSEEIISAHEIPALSYFFQKRNEPIWKMKRLCPVCRQWLIVQEYEGSYIWRCAFCNGLFVDQDKLPRIFVREEKGFTEDVQRLARLLMQEAKKKHPHFQLLIDTSHPRPCPKCGKPMTRKFFSYAYHVEIDECPLCKVIWFDADELESLQGLIEREERS